MIYSDSGQWPSFIIIIIVVVIFVDRLLDPLSIVNIFVISLNGALLPSNAWVNGRGGVHLVQR